MNLISVHRNEINPEKWDDLVIKSDNGSVCAEFWYIDLLTHRNWRAVIIEGKNGEYSAAMPVF